MTGILAAATTWPDVTQTLIEGAVIVAILWIWVSGR